MIISSPMGRDFDSFVNGKSHPPPKRNPRPTECAEPLIMTSALENQVAFFLELHNILYDATHHLPLVHCSDVIMLYGDFENAEYYADFLNDLKQMERECENEFRFLRLNGSTEYLYNS